MSEWDASTVESRDQRLRTDAGAAAEGIGGLGMTRRDAKARFAKFLREYHDGTEYVYRERLIQSYRKEDYSLNVDLETLNHYDDHDASGRMSLYDALRNQPNEFIPALEDAAKEVLGPQDPPAPDIQVVFTTDREPMSIRHVSAAEVNRLLTLSGIVISAARARPKAISIAIRCKQCNNTKHIPAGNAFGSVSLPRSCDGQTGAGAPDIGGQPCPVDPFVIVPDLSSYVDHQVLKLQEPPDLVPTGEMPRHILLSVDRTLVDRITPGTRVTVTGVASIFNAVSKRASRGGGVSVRTPYIRVVGISTDDDGTGRTSTHFTHAEQEEFTRMSKDPDLYEKFTNSISPSISGDYTTDIKKAIACLLMGGSRKVLPDGMRLRGDINVLLLGDPSTAKSQFLKFVEKVAPVGVYTSGKGSSAAGLTASVMRDQKGEFHLEGGAMVLADGGVVCIDEFDKMREEDRVAIHEAMEQQTISVAKAGITTILNSRAAVLAAANPVFGRYDDEITAAENIDFLPTILSRFDLIFIVRDVRNYIRDRDIAKHVIRVHMNAGEEGQDPESVDIDITTMKKYIAFCRQQCAPRLTEDAAESLVSQYVGIRSDQRSKDSADAVIPITVRQLEALVRLSEALAKLNLKQEATAEHVREAIRLFRVSTLNAASAGISDAALTGELRKEVQRVEGAIKKSLNIGAIRDTGSVKRDLITRGFSSNAIAHAMRILAQRQDIQYVSETRRIRRLK